MLRTIVGTAATLLLAAALWVSLGRVSSADAQANTPVPPAQAAHAAAPALKVPTLPQPKHLEAKFRGKPSVEAYLAAGRSPERLVEGSLYYFLNLVDVLTGIDKRKGPRKETMDETIALLEEAVKAQPDNAVYLGLLGNAYGLKVTFAGFPALMGWAKNCQSKLSRAVRLEPNNPEVRLLRLRSYVHFPHTYYPDLKAVVFEDAAIVLKWAADMEQAKGGDPQARDTVDYLRDIRNETIFMVGQYLHEQVKDDAAALRYLAKGDPKCWKYCDMVRSLAAELK